jgi:hypothetical protein
VSILDKIIFNPNYSDDRQQMFWIALVDDFLYLMISILKNPDNPNTDSLYFCLAEPTILECIPTEKREQFKQEAKRFLVLEEDPNNPLIIGKFKIEASCYEAIAVNTKVN